MADRSARRAVDQAVAAFAARRWGVFLLTDVTPLGLSAGMASDRVKAGRLFRLHVGVYSVIPPNLLRAEGRWFAAVLACGRGAVLSQTSAAALWEIRAIGSGPIHVTVPGYAGRGKRKGIAIHRSGTLLTTHMTVRRGIPVTSAARTLSDLRRMLPRSQYGAALRQAEIRRLDTGGAGGEEPAMTAFEQRLRNLCRRHGLPLPRAQQVIGPHTVDFLWPDQRLVVEMDDFRTHRTRTAFESDRARDAWLMTQGYRVLRLTWRQLRDEPAIVVATLRAMVGPGLSRP
jgi:very-short-patch-repair endonuclease